MRAPSETIATEGFEPPAFGEPYLLTPGPLTTALSVKQAMLRDWGSWDGDFRGMTADLRRRLLALTGDPRYRPSLWLRRRAALGISLLTT